MIKASITFSVAGAFVNVLTFYERYVMVKKVCI